jgi:hypothetical protein
MRLGMNRRLSRLAMIAITLAVPAAAQHPAPHGHNHHAGPSPPPPQPYAGLQARRLKALSEEQLAELRAGAGMGLALAAELNGYPGPMHVLQHADAIGLSPAQRSTAEDLRARMLAEARAIGTRIAALEEELDALFAGGAADTGRLAMLTAAIGALNGRLREVHLVTHIAMRDALDEAQRTAYARLRGYAAAH